MHEKLLCLLFLGELKRHLKLTEISDLCYEMYHHYPYITKFMRLARFFQIP